MTRETKVGIAMVLLLFGVFGFLVYKRFTRPIDAMAENEPKAVDEVVDAPEADRLDLEPSDEFLPAGRQGEPEILPVAGSSRQIPRDEPGEVDDPFGSSSNSSSTTTAASTRPKLPTMIPDDEPETDDGVGFTVEPEAGKSLVRSDEPDIDANDPFLDSPGTVSAPDEKVVSSPPAMQFEEEEPAADDPFNTDLKPATTSTPNIATREPEFDEPSTVSVQARTTLPEETFDFEDTAAEEQTPELRAEPERPAAQSPAPQLMLDDSDEDRYGDYEPIELVDGQTDLKFAPRAVPQIDFFDAEADTRRTAVTINGDSHVVQPGENFWNISQKKYGTGRYFQALAAHNHRTIPDPAKMKPGVAISLPSEDELERRYANLIPKGGPSEPAAAAGQVNQPGELLMGQDGRPLYRIGTKDTLSEISQKYLGRSSRWMQIFEMNRDVLKDGNSLKVGAVLRLPSDAGELQLSNQPRVFR